MLDPAVWGPPMWIFLHSITINYPECPTNKEKEYTKNFFILLPDILPCPKCTNHLKQHYKKYPLTDEILCSKKSFVKWLIDLHNEVNVSSGKKRLADDDIFKKYYKMYNKTNYNNIFIYLTVIIVVLIIIISMIKLLVR